MSLTVLSFGVIPRAVIESSYSTFDSLEARSNLFIKLNESSPSIILRLVS